MRAARRVADDGQDEIAGLGRAFNAMATRLQATVQADCLPKASQLIISVRRSVRRTR